MREEVIGGQTLVLANCLEVLPGLTCGITITDPPYGTNSADWDTDPPAEVWQECIRLAPQGPVALFAYPECHLRWAQFFTPLKPIACIAWWHYNHPTPSGGLTRHWQEVVVWGCSRKQITAGDVREPYVVAERQGKFCHVGMPKGANGQGSFHPDGRRMTDLWRIPAPGAGFNSRLRRHRNEKPMECMERLVRLLTVDGQTVVDPYMGSGTTLAAAELWGRSGIGIEQDASHFDTACRRVEEAVRKREADASQLTLTEAMA